MAKRIFGMVVAAIAVLQAGQARAQDADWRDGRKVFQRCASCHSLRQGINLFGPSLIGVFGRRAGALPEYPYSEGMKAKGAEGLVWTAETLDLFLTKPAALVPGTKMNFPGLPGAQDRANVIAYVKRRAER